ncbi:TatD family hydrolase [Neobacillus sedimentimangrovi]|uniref:TatD family hydrolase n=1 Tax=Neobacillus sedimentimangrovi TaxID=2699460 RepID=A0ABS8QI67_9BACI|nr:TatD family hydrolase [Neobacillus sedimentimangrovi]MCD4838304.1 TatD family hydrolase [Neobacillus sedimentimangrovi]
MKIIDAHIHLDRYEDKEIESMLKKADWLEALVSVSFDLHSCKRNLRLNKTYSKVKPAFGFHPEQPLPNERELTKLMDWMTQHKEEMIAVGEVGLPYYLRKDGKVSAPEYGQYLELLETFLVLAKKWEKPIVLHAVYDDAPVVCDLLEKHNITKALFHWFKGDQKTTSRMMTNGYSISVTPEILYKEKIQQLAKSYPLEQIMVETDGPWPFDGPFTGQKTHPNMIKYSISTLAKIKKQSEKEVSEQIYKNTRVFYRL